MMRMLKAFLALLLIVCFMTGFMPEPFIATVGESIQAQAEARKASSDNEPVSDELESRGWRYRVCADGYVELSGYADESVTSLTFPAALEGRWVVRVAEGAFEDNTAVTSVSVPAQINEIPSSAFPNNAVMTVHAYNGTAALKYASIRGFTMDNQSRYDLFDDILDLSDMKSSQWSLSGHTATIDAPFSRLISIGARVYLPPKAEYVNGLPVKIIAYNPDEGIAQFSELNFSDAVESYKAENVQMTPDIEHIQILAEGIQFDATSARGIYEKTVSLPLSFNVDMSINEKYSLIGELKYKSDLFVSVEYGYFKINKCTYENSTTSSWEIKVEEKRKKAYKFKEELTDTTPKEEEAATKSLKFAKVPMIPMGGAFLIQVWLELSLEMSVKGEVSVKGELSTIERGTWKNGEWIKTHTFLNKPFDFSAAVSLSAQLKGAFVLTIGFKEFYTYIDVAEIAVSYKVEGISEYSTESPCCFDLKVIGCFKLSMRVGLLKKKIAGFESDDSAAFKADLFSDTKEFCKLHFEFPTFNIVNSCTLSRYAVVTFVVKSDLEETNNTATVEKGGKILRPSNPSRTGYTFVGWYKDIHGEQAWDFDNDTVTEDINLYAKWINNATGQAELPDPDGSDDDPSSYPPWLLPADWSLPYLQYTVGDSGVTIYGYNDAPEAITIPDTIEGKPVTSIGSGAFNGCSSLVEILLPDSIEEMGAWAFKGTSLTSVRTPKNWTGLLGAGISPFAGCTTLESVEIPEGATVLPDYAFKGSAYGDNSTSSIKSISLPSTLVSIGRSAFYGTSISSIGLPDSITSMGGLAFKGTKLTSVRTPKNWTEVPFDNDLDSGHYYSPFCGCTTLKSVEVPEGATVVPDHAFRGISVWGNEYEEGSTSSITSISLPSTLTMIGDSAFAGTSISTIYLADSITSMGAGAFKGTNLTSVRIPINWTENRYNFGYGFSPFGGCTTLKSVVIPDGVTVVPDNAFDGLELKGYSTSSITSISLPSTLTKIGLEAFAGTSISEIYLADSITFMGNYAFKGTQLTSVRTPKNWTSDYWMDHSPFGGCTTLKSVEIPEGATVVPDNAFRSSDDNPTSSITNISLPSTLTKIGYSAFSGTSISTIYLADSITDIGGGAFTGTGLTSVRTPKNWIGGGSPFDGCTTLKSVEVPEGAKAIPDHAFYGSDGITNISLPSTLMKIGTKAFYGTGVSELILPEALEEIGDNAFSSCNSLTRLIFLGDVYDIGKNIASDSALSQVYIPADSNKLGGYFFRYYFSEVEIFDLPSSYHTLSWMNTGDTTIPDQIIQSGMRLTKPGSPSRKDHTFAGWYSDEGCAMQWDFVADVMPDTDLTLYAKWDYTPSGFIYTIDDGMATITGYEGDSSNLVIPDALGGAAVTTLAASSIPGTVSSLTLSKGIVSIDEKAFVHAGKLVSIRVDPENTTYREESGVLFMENTLVCYPQNRPDMEYDIPDTVETIGVRAFCGCHSLNSLYIPASVNKIAEYGVYNCENLCSVICASDIASIADGNFLLCPSDLNIIGPIGALSLTAYADNPYVDYDKYCADSPYVYYNTHSSYVNYNMYDMVFIKDDDVIGVGTIRAGERIGELPALEYDESAFIGWSTTQDGRNLWTDSNAIMPAADITFYAIFRHPFEYVQLDYGVMLTKYTGTDTRVRIPNAIDWFTDVIAIDSDCFSNKDITLIGDKGSFVEDFALAQGMDFEALTYTLAFETNGGRKIAPLTLAATDEIPLPTPIRTGYEFMGWYIDQDLTAKWVEGDEMPANDLTLYARWKRTDETAVSIPFTFEATEAGLSITGFTGTFGKVDIPSSINGEEVASIAEYAFADNTYIQVVTVPASIKEIHESAFAGSALYSITMAGVEHIGDYAFAGCASLAYVTLPDTLLEMGTYAFQDCSALLSVDIPDEVTELKAGVFAGCEWLTEIKLPARLETIQSGAFQGCRHLECLSLGANVCEIHADAFEGCGALKNYTVSESNMYYKSENGVLFNKNGTQLMLYPRGKKDSSYTIPSGVTTIASDAMCGTRMTTLNLNSELKAIGAGALSSSTVLETIGFNTELLTIGANAFDGCVSLADVTLPESVKRVGAEAFDMTGLVRIYVPSQTELGKDAIPALDGLTIYGHRGSEAEIYANDKGIRFIDSSADIAVTGISIPETLRLQPGSSSTLRVTFTPSDTTETTVAWSSDDETIAHVTDTGSVEARSEGTVDIIAEAANGSVSVCSVTVARQPIIATSISLSSSRIVMDVGDMRSVSATVLPINADNGAVTWSVDDVSVVSWLNGNVVGLREGNAVLTAVTAGGLTASCNIVVGPVPEPMSEPDFTLPQALTSIEAEAFTGLTMKVIKCPEGLKTIEAKAFADCKKLEQIYIPATVTSIASDAFSGCGTEFVIYGKSGSEAETFAESMGFLFIIYE